MPKQVPVTREALHNIADPAIELLLRKNHDYGNSWSRQGLAGVLVRLSDKFYRFQNLSGNTEAMVADEKIEDTLQDALAYCMLGLLYLRTDSFEPEPEALVSAFSRFRSALSELWGEIVETLNLTLESPKDHVAVIDVPCKGRKHG